MDVFVSFCRVNLCSLTWTYTLQLLICMIDDTTGSWMCLSDLFVVYDGFTSVLSVQCVFSSFYGPCWLTLSHLSAFSSCCGLKIHAVVVSTIRLKKKHSFCIFAFSFVFVFTHHVSHIKQNWGTIMICVKIATIFTQ